jgi:hypothetical protein
MLSRRRLNRAVLQRQLLLERAELSIPQALQHVGGLQSQYAPTMYIGLWSRLRDFRRADLTVALQDRHVVQGTLLRVTIHLVAAEDYWPFAVAIRERNREWWLRVTKQQWPAADLEAAAGRLRRIFGGEPLRAKEVEAAVGKGLVAGVGLWLELVRVPPSGTWERRRADLYLPAEDWLGAPDIEVEDAKELVVRRYLTGFGPAAPKDIATWAQLPVKDVNAALARLETRDYRDEDGTRLVDLAELTVPPEDVEAPVRFLGTWEAALLVHARRSGILPEQYRPLIFHTRKPQSERTFLVDGAVAGTWRCDQDRVELKPFRALTRAETLAVQDGADRLAEFHA